MSYITRKIKATNQRVPMLTTEDIGGTPIEIIQRIAGTRLEATNGWGMGTVIGAWNLKRPGEEPHVRILLACPNADNPVQLFNEDARDYLPKT